MVCGCCNRGIVLVSGRHGGYYGCVAARVRGCDNRVRVRRDLAEKIIVNALQERLADPRAIRYVFEQLREEVARLSSDVPDQIRRRKEQLGRERRRLDNFVNFIADGRDSPAVRDGLQKTEQKVLLLEAQIAELTRTSSGFRVPSLRTIERRCKKLRALLDSSIQRSALVVRELLAPIRLDPVVSASGRRYYVARTTFDTLKLLEDLDPDGGSDPGATAFKWWSWMTWRAGLSASFRPPMPAWALALRRFAKCTPVRSGRTCCCCSAPWRWSSPSRAPTWRPPAVARDTGDARTRPDISARPGRARMLFPSSPGTRVDLIVALRTE